MHPVTITLPFSAIASPMAPSDSCLALSRKPQVLTRTRSAPSCLRDSSYPSARSRVMMRSESTSALGQPRETKLTFGASAGASRDVLSVMLMVDAASRLALLVIRARNSVQHGEAALVD